MRMTREAVALFLALAGLLLSSAAEPALNWKGRDGYRFARLQVSGTAGAGFTLMPALDTSVLFTNHVSFERAVANKPLLEGGGVAAGDFDGDGFVDLYFCSVEGSNALFRNRGGFKFQDVTREAAV